MIKRRVYVNDGGNTEVKVYLEDGEYTARIYVAGKLQFKRDYFTDDKDDAIATADAMLAEELDNQNL